MQEGLGKKNPIPEFDYIRTIKEDELTNTPEEALFMITRSIGLHYKPVLWMFNKDTFYQNLTAEVSDTKIASYMKLLRLFYIGMPDIWREYLINYYFIKNVMKYFNAN